MCKDLGGVLGIIDDQGRNNKTVSLKQTAGTLRRETHGNEQKAVLEIPVRQATKQGYAVARGGEMQSTSHSQTAKQEEDESG